MTFLNSSQQIYTISGQGSGGLDLVNRFYQGLIQRLKLCDLPPHALADCVICCATPRLLENLKACFVRHGGILPRLSLLKNLYGNELHTKIATPTQRYILLMQLVETFLDNAPHLTSEISVFHLTESLMDILDLLYQADVPLEALEALEQTYAVPYHEDVHEFLRLIAQYWPHILKEHGLIEADVSLKRTLSQSPESMFLKNDTCIALGFTGRHTLERHFLKYVLNRPKSAIILHGYDPFLDAHTWDKLTSDHNQFCFKKTFECLKYDREHVCSWDTEEQFVQTPRMFYISQALYPPPVTDSWYAQKETLRNLADNATAGMTLIEADHLQEEASAIIIKLREVLQTPGKTASVITADHNLSRLIKTSMARWNIVVDDAAGRPLSLTPPGILSSLALDIAFNSFDLSMVFALLRHPLCNLYPQEGRATHLRHVQELQKYIYALKPMELPPASWDDFCGLEYDICRRMQLLFTPFMECFQHPHPSLQTCLQAHYTMLQNLGITVFEQDSGETMQDFFHTALQDSCLYQRALDISYRALYTALIQPYYVRTAQIGHPRLSILNPREVQTQQSDVLIISSLNEDTFPMQPSVGAWLNRTMRQQMKLPEVEEKIGESAFDLYCALLTKEVVLTRAQRSGDAPTVPSRWLMRLLNLLKGVVPDVLERMRHEGQTYVQYAQALEMDMQGHLDVRPCSRPYPKPPLAARQHTLSATQVERFILNPYAIYARKILGLQMLPPLFRTVDHAFYGVCVHKALEEAMRHFMSVDWNEATQQFSHTFDQCAQKMLDSLKNDPLHYIFLAQKLSHTKSWITITEYDRRASGYPQALEVKGQIVLETDLGPISLIATADRIDRTHTGRTIIYDYKTGASVPKKADILQHKKQLLIEAALVLKGGFQPIIPASAVESVAYLKVGKLSTSKEHKMAFSEEDIESCIDGVVKLLNAYADPELGYGAHMRPMQTSYVDEYDHLARVGEWSYSV